MAYIYSTSSTTTTTSPITPLTAEHATDDILFLHVVTDGFPSSWPTISGWTLMVGGSSEGRATNNSTETGMYWKRATSSSTTMPSVATGRSDDHIATLIVVRDAVASGTPYEDLTVDVGGAQNYSTVPVTPWTTDGVNRLVIHFHGSDGGRRPFYEAPVNYATSRNTTNAIASAVGWNFYQSSGATIDQFTINLDGSVGRADITFAVPPAAAVVPGYQDPASEPFSIVNPMTGVPSTSGGSPYCGTWDDDSATLTASWDDSHDFTYNALALQSTASPMGRRAGEWCRSDSASYNLKISGGTKGCTSVDTSAGSGYIVGHIKTDFLYEYLADYGVGGQYAGGMYIGVRSGTGGSTAYRVWPIATRDTTPDGFNVAPFFIDLANDTGFIHEVGTFDETDVTGVFQGIYRTSNEVRYACCNILLIRPIILIGGSSGKPSIFRDFRHIAESFECLSVLEQVSGQFLSYQDLVIGNGGTDVTYFSDTGVNVKFPEVANEAAREFQFRVAEDTIGFKVDLGSSDTLTLTNSVIGGVSGWLLVFDIATGATVDLSGTIFSNADVTFTAVSGTELNNCTFLGCKTLTNPPDLDGSIVDASKETNGITITGATESALQTALDKLDGCTIRNNTKGLRIESTYAGDIALDCSGITAFSGNTTDVHYSSSHASSTLTLTAAGALTTSVEDNETVNVVSPTVALTVNSSESGSDIKIFNTGTQTIEASATGTTVNTENAGTYDWTVQKAGFLPQRGTAVVLGASSVTVDVTLVEDPVYNSSHGLTFTTDYSYDASTRTMTIVANQEGRDLYSALIDDFISETTLRNCPFPLFAVGPDRIDFLAVGYYNTATTVGATIDSGDITFWKGAGMEWEHDTTGNPTKKFYSIKSANSLQSGSVVGYTQVNNGTPVESTLVSDKVNQVIQYFEDTNGDGSADYAYTGHLLFKGFKTGYYQARWDVINDSGVTALESYEYTINLLQDAIAGTTGNQSITITTLTDHTSSPLVVGSKNFDYELVDPGTNTAENLLSQYNYDIFTAVDTSISGTIYTSYTAFDLPDLLVEAGSNYETEYGYFEGDGAVTDLSGVYLSRSSLDHPGIARFQSNDGTYYTPAVTADITITGMPTTGANIRLQVHNETAKTAGNWAATTAYSLGDKVLRTTGLGSEQTAGLYMVCTVAGTSGGTEPIWDTTVGNTTADSTVTWTTYAILYYDNNPSSASYADTYTDGEEFADGDTYRIRFAEMDGGTSFKTYENTGLVSSSGFTVAVSVTADSVYAANAIDGSGAAVTAKFTADYANDEIDLDANQDFAVTEAFAYYCYELTTSSGMYEFWGAVDAIDSANYKNITANASIYFDETAGFVKQTDSARWYRDDDTRPVIDPTTGGAGLELNWRNPVYQLETGVSGLTGSESTELFKNSTIISNLAVVDTIVDSILEDTGTTLPAQLTTIDTNVDDIVTRLDLNASKPNTYKDDNSEIGNSDFTLTKTDNGDGTFTVSRA